MSSLIPITLTSDMDNLGKRHRHLNLLVRDAIANGTPFQIIQNVPEKSPVDRLYKIDLASKLRNVEYIVENLKDEDSLFVCRALKSKWLLDSKYQDIISPSHLEDVLYPSMWTTAVNKMRNWLYLNLKDPQRCKEFYQYYREKKIEFAIKFLRNCSAEFILKEAPNVLEKLTPHNFKILCEKCPQVAKVYFDNLTNNETLKLKFLDDGHEYYNSLKVVLKLDADIFFNITEKYFDKKFSRPITKYIMNHHKVRVERKPELYAALLLHMETLAECLNVEECKETVIKLARAKYLSFWFSYKNVEPLVKRLSVDERTAFKKRVFVDKDVGKLVEEWPYEPPSLPTRENQGVHVFEDREHAPYQYECLDEIAVCKKFKLRKRNVCKAEYFDCALSSNRAPMKTYLDKLFEEYRFVGFERTLFELRKKIGAESASQNRQYMMLVLVSKSGGRAEYVTSLLEMLEQHLNEPSHIRATVIRSFVKRAAVWRLPQKTWESLLKFAHGLGLDGSPPEADCREGLHAVVLRSLLETGTCEPAIRDAFFKQFSTLVEYPTNAGERRVIREKLPELLLNFIGPETDSQVQAERLDILFDTLQSYKVKIDASPIIPAVATLANRDFAAAKVLLRRLFDAKIGRRTLFKENFSLIQTDASYVNALRHDISTIDVKKMVDLIEQGNIRPEQFLRKISIYFTEQFGLVDYCLTEMKGRVIDNPDVKPTIARPICLLMGANLMYLRALNEKDKNIARIAAAVRANMHAGRLKLDINEMGLSAIGAKGVANKVLPCPATEANGYIQMLLKWKRTAKLAVLVAQKVNQEVDAFAAATVLNPTAAIKAAVKYFCHKGDSFDPRVWDIIKPLMEKFDFSKESRHHLRNFISKVDDIPLAIRPEYCIILFKAFQDHSHYKAMSILCHIELLLPSVNEEFIEFTLLENLHKFVPENVSKLNDSEVTSTLLYLRVLVKYLLLCKSEETQTKRMHIVCDPFLSHMESLYKTTECKNKFMEFLEELLLTLKYNKVFFDVDYVSPLPVMEKIVSWMRKNLPTELHFEIYVHIHLTMLYYKSIRHSIKQIPDVFVDEKRKLKEGIDMVGRTFGRYIAREIKELMSTYFESIIGLYRNGLEDYLTKYFEYDVTKTQFIVAIVKGILQGSEGAESKMAVYILKYEYFNIAKSVRDEIMIEMKKIENMEMKFFLFAQF